MNDRSARWRFLLILLIVTAVLAGCRSSDKVESTPIVESGPTATGGQQTLLVLPDDGIAPVLDLIDNAKTSIRFKIYLLTQRDVRAALIRAANRGVNVRVQIEQNPVGGGESNRESYDALLDGGVQVRWTDPAFQLTHEKSLVIDDRTALVGTFNYTASSFGGNREYGIISTEPPIVSEVAAIFDTDWNGGDYELAADMPLVVSPLNSRQTIQDLIDGAQTTLWLEQSTLLDDAVTDRLVAAARRGVDVRFIGPLRGGEDDVAAPNHARLREAGGEVALLADPLVHAKVILADDETALIGSINLTYSSMELNRELGLVTTAPAVLARLRQTMAADWERASHVATAPDGPITWQEAADYVGAEVTVEGEIVRTHNTGKVTFLNFDDDFRNTLTLVIFPDDAQLFPQPPEDLFLHRRVQARGLVKEYQGAPEIIIDSPAQLRLLDDDTNETSTRSQPIVIADDTVAASPPADEALPWQEAANHIGQEITVEGEVVRTYDSGNVTFLNFTDNWRGTFSVVIFAADYDKYPRPPAELFLDQLVQVKGSVKEYQGAPEIVVEAPEQIQIITDPAATAPASEASDATPAPAAPPASVIPWQDAPDYLGQTITVSGRIINANDIGTITFLNFSNERGQFVAVIFVDDYAAFSQPPVELYDGREVWITGEVESFRNVPQIIVRSPEQIEVFD